MTTNRDFKRLVRGRMQKTGESYTAARSHLLRQPKQAPTPPAAREPAPVAIDYAKLAGMSDAAVKAKTGCAWDRWVWALDKARAYEWSHAKIAEYVHTKYKVGDWWGQTVTVGYERIKGLRAIGQRRDGGYEASKSKTIAVPLSRLYRAFSHKRDRERWMPGQDLTVRSAARDKYMRITWPDGTAVELVFASKGRGKSQVAVAHGKLPDQAAVQRMKESWGERLEALARALSEPAPE
jgi:uncharacterized protein YndB with AHSA1/START domain